MSLRNFIFIIIALIFSQASSSLSQCIPTTDNSGNISNSFTATGGVEFYKCWEIANHEKQLIQLKITSIGFYNMNCLRGNITIKLKNESRNLTFCNDQFIRDPISTFSDVQIVHYLHSSYFANGLTPNFTLIYIKTPKSILSEAHSRATSWIYNQRLPPLWDLRENTQKAVMALLLSGATNSSSCSDQALELMVKQAELKVVVALHRDNVSEMDLGMFINFLLVTCNNPRRFTGYNLIERLRKKIESSRNFTHPIAYLALCNANETWPDRAVSDLTNILNKTSEYPFFKDIQAFAVMAVACKINQVNEFRNTVNPSLITAYNNTVRNLKEELLKNKSRTASEIGLLSQAVISSGMDYFYFRLHMYNIMKKLNSSTISFQAVYFVLPLLSNKTLTDIAKIDCSGHPRRAILDIYKDEKSRIVVPTNSVRYSLFIGDKKEIIHTISVKLPLNSTANLVMELAQLRNSVFRFNWQRESGKMYVYNIAQTPNDPETGKFWLLYLGSNREESITRITKGPDELVLKNEDHLVMWYKTADM